MDLNKAKDVVDIVADMVDSEPTYKSNYLPSDISEVEENSKTKVAAHSHKVKIYVQNEDTMKKSEILSYIW